ncbi:MAG: hypothetical protein VCB42_01955 [Myxococcota bacterium]
MTELDPLGNALRGDRTDPVSPQEILQLLERTLLASPNQRLGTARPDSG